MGSPDPEWRAGHFGAEVASFALEALCARYDGVILYPVLEDGAAALREAVEADPGFHRG